MMHHIKFSKLSKSALIPALVVLTIVVGSVISAYEISAQSYMYPSDTSTPSNYMYQSDREAGTNEALRSGTNNDRAPGENNDRTPGENNDSGGSTNGQGLQNPLGPGNDSLEAFLINVIKILRIFAVPIIVFMIIYAGFLYVLARGSEEQVTKATRALTYAIVGGLLILGAELILRVLQGTVSQIAP